jgi:hypothetical protein
LCLSPILNRIIISLLSMRMATISGRIPEGKGF